MNTETEVEAALLWPPFKAKKRVPEKALLSFKKNVLFYKILFRLSLNIKAPCKNDAFMDITLTDLKLREAAEIVSFEGGGELQKRLEGMGIRQGKKIFRFSSHFINGPVIISIDGHLTAIGRGMAEKVRVRPVLVSHNKNKV